MTPQQFKGTKVKWTFWALSNDIDDIVVRMSTERGRALGIYHEDPTLNITVLIKTWAQVVNECQARLEFLRTSLNYDVKEEHAMTELRRLHGKYLPPSIAEDDLATPEAAKPPATAASAPH